MIGGDGCCEAVEGDTVATRTSGRISPGVVWSWPALTRGVLLGSPAAVVTASDLQLGAVLAIGVLPVAAIPLAPLRRGRIQAGLVGLVAAMSLLMGGVLAQWPTLAVTGILVMAPLAAHLSVGRPAALLTLTLALPLMAVGFSYPGISAAAPLAAALGLGAAYATAVSLLWPPQTAEPATPPPALPRDTMLRYGYAAGVAGAGCAAVGFTLHLEHVGWAPAAALLVMRPVPAIQRLRSLDRVLDVVVGAAAAIAMTTLEAPDWLYALVVLAGVAAATATAGSRWYLLPALTTYLAFVLLLYDEPGGGSDRFWERVLETVLGVGAAAVFGLLLPALMDGRPPLEAEGAPPG